MGLAAMPQRWSAPQTRRVVLAEDDPDLCGVVASVLRRDGYQVEAVEDGQAALRLLGKVGGEEVAQADLLVTDLQMPGCTGMELLERLRRGKAAVQVIIMTAFGDWTTHQRARKLDARVLDKPFDLDDLRRLVFDLLELR